MPLMKIIASKVKYDLTLMCIKFHDDKSCPIFSCRYLPTPNSGTSISTLRQRRRRKGAVINFLVKVLHLRCETKAKGNEKWIIISFSFLFLFQSTPCDTRPVCLKILISKNFNFLVKVLPLRCETKAKGNASSNLCSQL